MTTAQCFSEAIRMTSEQLHQTYCMMLFADFWEKKFLQYTDRNLTFFSLKNVKWASKQFWEAVNFCYHLAQSSIWVIVNLQLTPNWLKTVIIIFTFLLSFMKHVMWVFQFGIIALSIIWLSHSIPGNLPQQDEISNMKKVFAQSFYCSWIYNS